MRPKVCNTADVHKKGITIYNMVLVWDKTVSYDIFVSL